MKLLGISGTNGAGKDSVADALVKNHKYMFVSVSDLLRVEAKKRGLSTERVNLRAISTQWRSEHNLGVIIDKAVELYEEAGGDAKFEGLVVSSLRNPGEAERVHELDGHVIWVDADQKVRYERIFSRARDDDNKTFEQFAAEELAEMKHNSDVAALSMLDVKALSDLTIMNEGNDLMLFEDQVSEQLVDLSRGEHE